MKSGNYGKATLGAAAGQSLPAGAPLQPCATVQKPAPKNPEVNNFDQEGNTQLHNASYTNRTI